GFVGRWADLPPYNFGAFDRYPALNLSDNAGSYLRFIGLEITHVLLPPEPLWSQGNGLQNGSSYGALIYQNYPSDHIVWDRCWIHGEEPARIQFGGFFDGSNVAVIDSYFDGLQIWQGP